MVFPEQEGQGEKLIFRRSFRKSREKAAFHRRPERWGVLPFRQQAEFFWSDGAEGETRTGATPFDAVLPGKDLEKCGIKVGIRGHEDDLGIQPETGEKIVFGLHELIRGKSSVTRTDPAADGGDPGIIAAG